MQENDDFDAPPSPTFSGRMGLVIVESARKRRVKAVFERFVDGGDQRSEQGTKTPQGRSVSRNIE